MGFIFSGLFWGIILVIFGLTVIVKAVFNIDIPVFRIIFAVVLIYFGVKILVGNRTRISHGNSIIFDKAKITSVKGENEYNIIFGSGDIDLTDIELTEDKHFAEVNVVFGSGKIFIDKDIPVIIKATSVFADCQLPKGNSGFFGERIYKSDSYSRDDPALTLEVTVVFGNANIIAR